MSVHGILREAKAVILRAHTPVRLAVDARGVNVRPLDPAAVAWSSTGAVGKVAPWMSITDERIWFDLTEDGNRAWDLLNEAARLQGYGCPDAPIADADREGLAAALACFDKAIRLAPDEPRRRRNLEAVHGTGAAPRGAVS